jgi:hypothetical protein
MAEVETIPRWVAETVGAQHLKIQFLEAEVSRLRGELDSLVVVDEKKSKK